MTKIRKSDVLDEDEWKQAPRYVRDEALRAGVNGKPTVIGKNETLGWFVAQLHSRGPSIVWQQNKGRVAS